MHTVAGAETYEEFSNRIQLVVREMSRDTRYECLAVVFHAGPIKVLFRDIMKKGGIGDVGDCGFAECEVVGRDLIVKHLEGIVFNDGK